jgi:hypothetical protein
VPVYRIEILDKTGVWVRCPLRYTDYEIADNHLSTDDPRTRIVEIDDDDDE